MVEFNSILLKLKIYTSLLFTASSGLTLRMRFKPFRGPAASQPYLGTLIPAILNFQHSCPILSACDARVPYGGSTCEAAAHLDACSLHLSICIPLLYLASLKTPVEGGEKPWCPVDLIFQSCSPLNPLRTQQPDGALHTTCLIQSLPSIKHSSGSLLPTGERSNS